MVRCLIIEDEIPAQKVLTKYLEKIPEIAVFQVCSSAVEALPILRTEIIDLIFLDINMPELSGIDLLKSLTNPPKVILTTAYSEFAVESYEIGVVDYLLKPFSFQRFLKAVNRFFDLTTPEKTSVMHQLVSLPDLTEITINLKTEDGSQVLRLSEIDYLQAYGNYVKVHTVQKSLLIRETMSGIIEKLPALAFIQVHRSFIVQTHKICTVRANSLIVEQTEIPIGNKYRTNLLLAGINLD